jgi:hypothetical protein
MRVPVAGSVVRANEVSRWNAKIVDGFIARSCKMLFVVVVVLNLDRDILPHSPIFSSIPFNEGSLSKA